MTMLYVVFGMSGEFTSRAEWAVCYRTGEAEANALRDRCAAEAAAFYAAHPRHTVCNRSDVESDLATMFDPAFDWIGLAEYVVVPISDDPAELYRFNKMHGHGHQLNELRDQLRNHE